MLGGRIILAATVSVSNIFVCKLKSADQHLFSEDDSLIDLDTILGPTYSTRGIKRKIKEVLSDVESATLGIYDDEKDGLWRSSSSPSTKSNKNRMKNVDVSPEEELLQKFLHIKDEYHITDLAIKVMHDFFRDTKVPFYSMGEVVRVQRKTNHTIPLQYAKDFAYVPFEFALRARNLGRQ